MCIRDSMRREKVKELIEVSNKLRHGHPHLAFSLTAICVNKLNKLKLSFSSLSHEPDVISEMGLIKRQPRSQGLSSLPPLSQRQWRQRREILGMRLIKRACLQPRTKRVLSCLNNLSSHFWLDVNFIPVSRQFLRLELESTS